MNSLTSRTDTEACTMPWPCGPQLRTMFTHSPYHDASVWRCCPCSVGDGNGTLFFSCRFAGGGLTSVGLGPQFWWVGLVEIVQQRCLSSESYFFKAFFTGYRRLIPVQSYLPHWLPWRSARVATSFCWTSSLVPSWTIAQTAESSSDQRSSERCRL